MEDRWKAVDEDLRKIKITSTKNNELVTIGQFSQNLECIGVGTDAAVFKLRHEPTLAFKVYAEDKLSKLETEFLVYQKLGKSEWFPALFGRGHNYLVISYEEGMTLYDCLRTGSHIPKQVLMDVEEARNECLRKGLNPRDIHLKNILLQKGRAKLLDVSEYMYPGNDYRWNYLKQGYEEYYGLIDGKKIPLWIIESVRLLYQQSADQSFDFKEFTTKLVNKFKNFLSVK
ncbi:serine/threonine protein kinase [Cytobacillus suaedae]|nr:serine/threonine protein kinase [Cytobacillus suaedae]